MLSMLSNEVVILIKESKSPAGEQFSATLAAVFACETVEMLKIIEVTLGCIRG